MEKLDLKKVYKHLYLPTAREVTLVDVPPLTFAMIDGRIESGAEPASSPAFQQALGALYAVSYTLKFAAKKRAADPFDFTVMALEALWWVEGGSFDIARPDDWQWTAMILQPDRITPEMFAEAVAQAQEKKPNPALADLRLERFHEGLCVQIMHIGPYADEPATIEKMHAFARENGYRPRGRHHEIYLGDPRRAAPEKLKTVLRQPVE